MNGVDIFLILLSVGTIAIVVVVLKPPFFITDKGGRAYQAIHFLLGIIEGYIFPSFLGEMVLGMLKELVGIPLAAYRGLLSPERMLRMIRALLFWVLGGFFGSHTLEKFHYSVIFLLET